jgi:glutaredoxin
MNNCPHCVTAKKYLEQKKISFRLCNVKTTAGQKEFLRTGFRSVPSLKIADQLIAGFNPKQIEKILNQ